MKATLVSLMLGCISLTIYEGIIRLRAADRYLASIVFIMFLAGAAMTWVELRKWWKIQTERFGEPPFDLSKFLPRLDKRSGRFKTSGQGLNQSTQPIEIVEPRNAA